MYGNVYGDLIGSLYEYKEFINHDVRRMIEASEKDDLLESECFISDDTILTVAIRDAYINRLAYDATLRKYILENAEPLNRENYFKYAFSPNIIKCAKGNMCGSSKGNGAIMRISPIPDLSKTFVFMLNEVVNATRPTHNSKEAIKAAMCVSWIIYLAKEGIDKDRIKYSVDKNFGYEYDFNLDKLRNEMFFNKTCDETMPLVLYTIFNSNSFDEAMRLVLSLGGDTDTNAAIVGGIAESLYGIDEKLKSRIDEFLPESYQKVLRSSGKVM